MLNTPQGRQARIDQYQNWLGATHKTASGETPPRKDGDWPDMKVACADLEMIRNSLASNTVDQIHCSLQHKPTAQAIYDALTPEERERVHFSAIS